MSDSLPYIVLVGRPNVGKSTLFNRLIRSNRAITHDRPGVTRDRMEGVVRRKDLPSFGIVDTGGITLDAHAAVTEGPEGIRGFERDILTQAEAALAGAAAVAFVVDGRDGLLPLDEHLAAHIRRMGLPTLCVVNKVDGEEREDLQMAEFHSLGFPLLPVSAEHGYNINALCEDLAALLPEGAVAPPAPPALRLAMLGRPNAGKSSLLNALLGYERAIVTDVPGTTRDTIDARVTLGGVLLRLTDTAGLRDTADPVEAIGVHRALDAAADAALAIAGFDAARPLDDDDRQVIAAVQAAPVRIAVLNKADLPAAVQPDALAAQFDAVCVLSAKERTGLEALEQAVAERFPAPDAPAGEILTNARHAEAIGRALESLRAAREAMLLGVTPDAVLTEAEEAMAAIGELTGASIREDITNRIFARFCVGK